MMIAIVMINNIDNVLYLKKGEMRDIDKTEILPDGTIKKIQTQENMAKNEAKFDHNRMYIHIVIFRM